LKNRTLVKAYIGLGSNLGNRRRILEGALREIGRLENTRVTAVSGWLENPAVGIENGEEFLNGVAEIETALPPRRLLESLLAVERLFGRGRDEKRRPPGVYVSRTLDLDLLLYGDEVIEEEGLVVPHPRMMEREFVLIPLKELGVIPGQRGAYEV